MATTGVDVPLTIGITGPAVTKNTYGRLNDQGKQEPSWKRWP